MAHAGGYRSGSYLNGASRTPEAEGQTRIANSSRVCPQALSAAARESRAARSAITVRSSGGSSTVKSARTEAR